MAKSDFLKCLDEFIEVTNEIISKLEKEKDWMEGHHTRCNVAKTGGTASSVVGSALMIGGLVAAPFTGGTSVIVLTGYGAALAVGGTAVNIGTDITDMITSRLSASRIDEICAKRNSIGERLSNYFDEVKRVAQELKAIGTDEENSFGLALYAVKSISKG